MKTKNPLAGSRNPELHSAMMGKRTSGAAGKHADRRTKRLRSRSAQRSFAIRDAS